MSYLVKYDEAAVQAAIDSVYAQLSPLAEDSIFLVLMNGGAWFSHELLRRFGRENLTVYYAKVSSYEGKEQGELDITYLPNIRFADKHVIVLDDICDTGNTINCIYHYIAKHQPASIQFATLVERVGASNLVPEVKLISGIQDHSKDFFVGCGLDDNDKGRNLPYIGVC